MFSVADIKTYVITRILYLQQLFIRIRLYLGWMPIKNGIVGHFLYDDQLPCSTLVHNTQRIDHQMKYNNFRPDDLMIFTYGKAGTHLTMGVVQSIQVVKGVVPSKSPELHIRAMELRPAMMIAMQAMHGKVSTDPQGTSDLDECPSPRIMVTHLPWRYLPQAVKDGKVKTIHCRRNPKDVACSAFTFFKKMNIILESMTWDYFVNLFFSKNAFHGCYMAFLKDWYPHRNQQNLLNVTFEDMIADLEGNVRRISKFMGYELSDEEVQQVVSENTFANKKKAAGKYHPIYNKGKSGGWRSQFTVEQNDMCDAYIEEHLKDMPDLRFDYK